MHGSNVLLPERETPSLGVLSPTTVGITWGALVRFRHPAPYGQLRPSQRRRHRTPSPERRVHAGLSGGVISPRTERRRGADGLYADFEPWSFFTNGITYGATATIAATRPMKAP